MKSQPIFEPKQDDVDALAVSSKQTVRIKELLKDLVIRGEVDRSWPPDFLASRTPVPPRLVRL